MYIDKCNKYNALYIIYFSTIENTLFVCNKGLNNFKSVFYCWIGFGFHLEFRPKFHISK